MAKDVRKRDGSGKGVKANKGRGGCTTTKNKVKTRDKPKK